MRFDDEAPLIDSAELRGIIAFLQAAEQLKDTLRSGTTAQGRPESTAEHTWRLCLMVLLFEHRIEGVDVLKLLKLCIVHDLGEAISGDVPAIHQTGDDGRQARERQDLLTLCQPLPARLAEEICMLWDEYAAAASPEAILAKGFDKLETMLQHVAGKNPPDFDYGFNLTYGIEQTDRHPLLKEIRALVDAETAARAAQQKSSRPGKD